MKKPVADNRKLVRLQAPVYIQYGPFASTQKLLGIAKNITVKGAGLVLEKSRDVSAGQVLDFILLFPEKKVTLSGVVAWTRYYENKQEAGVFFAEVEESQREAIHDYVYTYYPHELTRCWWGS